MPLKHIATSCTLCRFESWAVSIYTIVWNSMLGMR